MEVAYGCTLVLILVIDILYLVHTREKYELTPYDDSHYHNGKITPRKHFFAPGETPHAIHTYHTQHLSPHISDRHWRRSSGPFGHSLYF